MSHTLDLLQQLIRCPSLTPNDAGCQAIIAKRLGALQFNLESMRFGDVDNLWARHGDQGPLFVFAGHTDVVPTGPLDQWISPPFTPTMRDEYLYGRGATDMKSGLAAMVVATEQFIKKHPDHKGSIAFLITSDEEGASIDGTQRVMAELTKRSINIDYCVIGEATSETLLGDQIRVGRRGSLGGQLRIIGKQGHIAYPHIASNPIHLFAPALQELATTIWDEGNEFFPPTSFQISNIRAGTGATNIIPGLLEVTFNFRFSTAVTAEKLQQRVTTILEKYDLTFELHWNLSGLPFLTKQGKLLRAAQDSIKAVTSLETHLSTAGGTSDGRFIAPTGTEVIELGPCNTSAHQINEHIRVADLAILTSIYEQLLERILLS